MRPMPIKLMIHTDEIDQVDDPRMQTHELRPTNLDPQNRRSTIIGRAHSSANHIDEAQREEREERSERGKRKIEERGE